MALAQRLLRDIAELQSDPYPFIKWIPHEDNIRKACLILTPENQVPIHLSVTIPLEFPLQPPAIKCDTRITHPNVFGDYICATILNTAEGYTPAYTLKGIAIQILSFFTSENLEQDHGFQVVNLKSYSERHGSSTRQYICWSRECNSGMRVSPVIVPRHINQMDIDEPVTTATPTSNEGQDATPITDPATNESPIATLSDEILVMLCESLEDETLVNFSRTWNRIGGPSGLVSKFNIVRNRELQCFVLKKPFQQTQLGVGVRVDFRGRTGTIASEFDLISKDAFFVHGVRKSVQGVGTALWMPLPLSRSHYSRVQQCTINYLREIGDAARMDNPSSAEVVYHFMTDIIVKLSDTTVSNSHRQDQKTTLKHASEKAIESYFHLFHILLCLATCDNSIVQKANSMLENFLDGQTSKVHCPNLSHLLLAVLISDVDFTQDLLVAIITETITRNVVWMLDRKGADMPELAYLETDAVCDYRLSRTFQASATSYRLLMFFNLFRRTIARATGPDRKSLTVMCDALFDAHGAPPFGAAAQLAAQVKDIQKVNDFYGFLEIMDVEHMPTKQEMTELLRDCVEASMEYGYSVWGISQTAAKRLRDGYGRNYAEIHTFFRGRSSGWPASHGNDPRGQAGGRGRGSDRGRGRGRRGGGGNVRGGRGAIRGGRGGGRGRG
ncbi:hypothetical protein LTR84_004064 [Exophiala bonariae]|uniref:UBC core domain-containing protein n=1 Tax=Exophiala bonariae TaxID=1690606 RepID=A0AAV9N554_9EURO|nr:hypothetical protein LTR84_004064 [Exophiala bonariae]